MNRPGLILLFAVTAPLGLVACVDNNADAPMLILRNVAPGDGCTLDPGSSTFIGTGRIEASSNLGYLLTPVIRNDLTVLDGEATGPKTIFLEGARVDLSFYDATLFPTAPDAALTHFVTPLSGSLEPGGGTAAIGFEIVPAELLELIGAQLEVTEANPSPSTVVDAKVQVFGRRGGGETESNVFRYPVEVCKNCLLVDHGACTGLPSSFVPRLGGVCNPLQDGVIDCCDNGTVCPAAGTSGS